MFSRVRSRMTAMGSRNRIFTEITTGIMNPVQSTRAGRVRHSVVDALGWPAVVSSEGNNSGVWNPAIPSTATQNTMTPSGYSNIELWHRRSPRRSKAG